MATDGLAAEIEAAAREIGKFTREMATQRHAKDGHVAGGRMLGHVRQAGRIAEGRVAHTKAARPCGHHLGETFFRAAKIFTDCRSNVVCGFRNHRKGRIFRPNRLAGTKADLRGRTGGGIGRHGNARILVDAAGVDGFKQHIERHHLGQRRRIALCIGICREKRLAGVRINDDRGISVVAFRHGRCNGGNRGVTRHGC